MKTLKIALLSTVFALGAATAANAADIYEGEGSLKDTAVYTPPIMWGGFYFGGHIGAGFDDGCTYKTPGTANVPTCDDDDTVFIGGVHAGYNWEKHGPWVFGIEGDISFADDIDYLASIRGRVGYAMDNVLLYATGGAAFIGFEDVFGDSESEAGWVAGLGADLKVRDNVSVGLEGLYYDFDDHDYGGYSDEADFWVVRARLNYHLTRGYEQPLK